MTAHPAGAEYDCYPTTWGGRLVALRVVRSELTGDGVFRERFRHEIDAARKVRGPYTAELLDADPDAAPQTLWIPSIAALSPTRPGASPGASGMSSQSLVSTASSSSVLPLKAS
jgi:hypothetical protein